MKKKVLFCSLFYFSLSWVIAEICRDEKGSNYCHFEKLFSDICKKPDGAKYCRKTCELCLKPTKPPVPTFPPGKCGISSVTQSRIINGVNAKPGAWPWIASLQRYGRHFCGGTLIHPRWVLTASHCVMNIKSKAYYSIKLGAYDHRKTDGSVQTFRIKNIRKHPWFTTKTFIADLAMIELDKPAQLNNRVGLPCLPKENVYPSIGKQCYLAVVTSCYKRTIGLGVLIGWGSITYPGKSHHTLQQVKLPVVPGKTCKHQQEVVCVGNGFGNRTDGTQQPNACRGDSGGPLVCQQSDGSWQLEGVASYVYTYCKYYTGYAPVNKYLKWIIDSMRYN